MKAQRYRNESEVVNRVAAERLELTADRGREPNVRFCLFHAQGKPRVLSKQRGAFYPVNDRADARGGQRTVLFQRFVALPTVVIDTPRFQAIEEAFIELKYVPEMAPNAMRGHAQRRRGVDRVVHCLHDGKRL